MAFYEDYISYAGYFNSVDDVVLFWDGETKTPDYRGSYDTSLFGYYADDSVLTNVNSNGHLVLDEEFMLRAYRAWQIVNTTTANVMIEPEFNYTTSNNNITITPYNDREGNDRTVTASGTSSNNWVYLTPAGSGITYLEIGYDAVHIADGWEAGGTSGAVGQPSDFTWNASDPNRTALIVVQTDGNAASGITFGIQSPSGGWDYEYDTVYFTEDQGSLTMIPTGDVATVSVSHDKGSSYRTVTGSDGTYQVPIIDGNNIIRITDSNGKTAFQVVRGAQCSYTVQNLTDADTAISVGDEVRIDFQDLHLDFPKISGIYNPGYPNANKLQYQYNGSIITQGTGCQYDFHNNAWITFTVGNADIALTNGTMAYAQSYGSAPGALYQADAVNSSHTTSSCRSILPEINIDVEGVSVIPAEGVSLSVESVTLGITGTTVLTATVTPEDSTDTIEWTSSDDSVATVENGIVTAVATGEAVITVTVGEYSAACTVTVKEQDAGSFTIETSLADSANVFGATIGLSRIEVNGAMPVGEITEVTADSAWVMNIPAGTGDSLTISLTAVLGSAVSNAATNRYFWANGTVSSSPMSGYDGYVYQTTVSPDWNDDTATLTVGLGSTSRIAAKTTYTITITRVASEEEETAYMITFPEDQTGYSIVPADGSENPVAAGGSYSFQIEAADGYDVSNVTVMTSTEGALTAVDGVYTISNINSNVTVSIDGVVEAAKTYFVTFPENPEGYTVEILEGENPVEEGGTMTFQVINADGYEATDLAIKGNGETLEPADAKQNIYVLEKISADVAVTVEGVTKQVEASVSYGDLNGDGEIDVFDAQSAYSIANGKTDATEDQLQCMDVDGNGETDVFDAAIIYSYANGKRDRFPVEDQ